MKYNEVFFHILCKVVLVTLDKSCPKYNIHCIYNIYILHLHYILYISTMLDKSQCVQITIFVILCHHLNKEKFLKDDHLGNTWDKSKCFQCITFTILTIFTIGGKNLQI